MYCTEILNVLPRVSGHKTVGNVSVIEFSSRVSLFLLLFCCGDHFFYQARNREGKIVCEIDRLRCFNSAAL